MYEELIWVHQIMPIEEIHHGYRKLAFAVFTSEDMGYQIYVDRRKSIPVVEIVLNIDSPTEYISETEACIKSADDTDKQIMEVITQFAIPYAKTKIEEYLSDKKIAFALYYISEYETKVWLYDSLKAAKNAFDYRVKLAKETIREEEEEYGDDEAKPYEITCDSPYRFTYGTSDGYFVETDCVKIRLIRK